MWGVSGQEGMTPDLVLGMPKVCAPETPPILSWSGASIERWQ